MDFKFALSGRGWATVAFAHGESRYEIDASYLSDSPRELLAALVALLEGSVTERVTFMEEPGEVVLLLKRLPGELVNIQLFYGPDWGQSKPETGEPVFRHKMPLRQFARLVFQEFNQIDRELGSAGYKEQWVLHEFPGKPLRRLHELIKSSV